MLEVDEECGAIGLKWLGKLRGGREVLVLIFDSVVAKMCVVLQPPVVEVAAVT
jgi:hypothetical protein